MAEAYSKEFRRDVLAACDAGEGTSAVAKRFGACESWVRRVKQERRETGKVEAARTRDRRPDWEPYSDDIRNFVAEHPDAYLREIAAALPRKFVLSTICTALKRLGLSRKKRRSPPASRRDPTSPRPATRGEKARGDSTRGASSFSTKPGRKRT